MLKHKAASCILSQSTIPETKPRQTFAAGPETCHCNGDALQTFHFPPAATVVCVPFGLSGFSLANGYCLTLNIFIKSAGCNVLRSPTVDSNNFFALTTQKTVIAVDQFSASSESRSSSMRLLGFLMASRRGAHLNKQVVLLRRERNTVIAVSVWIHCFTIWNVTFC